MTNPPKTFWESFDLVHWMCVGAVLILVILFLIICFTPPPTASIG